MNITLIATTKFGLESLVVAELRRLGFERPIVADGRIEFEATLNDIPRLNLWLRVADRVLLKISQFEAHTFDQLFEMTKSLPWERWISEDGQFTVLARSVRSQLQSERSCQAIVKKAIAERLSRHYQTEWLAETGPDFTVQLRLRSNTAVLALDTSGPGLNKRGYRAVSGAAPLKETLAAALVMLSSWQPDLLFIDPLCGSGTIPIEAALIAGNIAPGLRRNFAAETWPSVPISLWETARTEAHDLIRPLAEAPLIGYDIDPVTVQIGQENVRLAGVEERVTIAHKDVKKLWIDQQYGQIIANPPYGMRLADFQTMNQIYVSLNKTFRKKKGWSVNILTADEKFPDFFKRGRPSRVQKLYNGNIKAYYYQYDGDRSVQ